MKKKKFCSKIFLEKWSKKHFKTKKTLKLHVKKVTKKIKKNQLKILTLIVNKQISVMKYLISYQKYFKITDSVWKQKQKNNFKKSYTVNFCVILLAKSVAQIHKHPKKVKFHIQIKLKFLVKKIIKFLWILKQQKKAYKPNLMLFLNLA